MVPSLEKRFQRLIQISLISILVIGLGSWVIADGIFSSKKIRVAVNLNAESVSLKVKGPYKIFALSSKKLLLRGSDLVSAVTGNRRGIIIGGEDLNIDAVVISTNGRSPIIINGRKFRGDINFISEDKNISVVNSISLQDYLKGILYHEVSHYWPMEALKAQAIVSRTYAIYRMQQNKNKDYDLTSDIYSQVYGGWTSERYRTSRAVEETEGCILTYENRLFPAFFHATCAGHTEDASRLWNIDMPPLAGLPCNYCRGSPHFNWHYTLSEEELREKLKAAGFNPAEIKDIVILDRDRSLRIRELKIVSDENDFTILAKDFRNIVGPNIIKSTNFDVMVVKQDIVFEGLGWGHGVGMCQWGAYFMAKEGRSAEEILKYYYPQSDVEAIGF